MNLIAAAGILVDLVIISIIISNAFWGYRRGLVNLITSLLAFIISLIIVLVLYKPVANMVMERTEIDEKLSQSIEDNLTGINFLNADGDINTEADTAMSETIEKTLRSFVEEALEKHVDNVIVYVSDNLAIMMIRVGTMLLLFMIARFAMVFVRYAFHIIANLPIIRLFNKSGGIIYGVLKGFIIIYAILAVLAFIAPIVESLGIILAIEDSAIGSLLYNNNLLIKFFF